MSYRPSDQHGATVRLLVVTERLYDAIASRDATHVRALLESAAATSIPRQVREEALAIVALPASSYRVPMALLRLHHRLTELARVDEDADDFRSPEARVPATSADPAQLEIAFGAGTRRRGRRADERWRRRRTN